MFFRARQPLAIHALCAVCGIVAANTLEHRVWPWAAALSIFLWLLWGVLRQRNRLSSSLAAGAATFALFFAWHGYLLADGPGAVLAASLPSQGRVVKITGVVDEEPAPGKRFRLRLQTVDGRPVSAPVLVRWKNGETPRYGDLLEITGDLQRIPAPRNPGNFDGPAYWRTQGITCELRVRYDNDVHLLGAGQGRPFVAQAIALRHWLEGVLTLDLEDSPELAALIRSMVLGTQGDSMDETRALFQYTGTMHLFAVSGMNVAMLGDIVMTVLLAAGISRRGTALAVLPVLWAFCYATGLAPSCLRATVMGTVYCGGFLLNRFALPWNTLGASALALLAWNPGTLFTSGFQLSFLMVAFLFLCAPAIQRWAAAWTAPDPFLPQQLWTPWIRLRSWSSLHLAEAALISLVAWIGSTPLMIHYFHLWSPSTVPANLIAALLTWLMLVLGLVSVAFGLFWKGAAILFNNANWLVAKTLLSSVAGIAAIPGSHVFVESPPWRSAPFCEINVLDTGGSGAIHLRVSSPGGRRDWLVDCGSKTAEGYIVGPYLRSQGVNRLDGLVFTHGDSQHIGGGPQLLRETPVSEVVESPLADRSPIRKAIDQTLLQTGRGRYLARRGDLLTLAPGVTLSVLFPPDHLDASRADDKALVLRLDAAGKRFLFSSDAGFRTETWLLENAAPGELQCDVWVKQNHASDLSGIPEFLDALRPSLIIAAGAAFPAERRIKEPWARDVQARGIRLLRQDRTGAVRLSLDRAGHWAAAPFLPAPAAPK